jgi:PKD repeat protein
MKRLVLFISLLILTGLYTHAQQPYVDIGGQVTDIETGIPVGGHVVYAMFNDSISMYTFQTDAEGYYGDTIYFNGMFPSSVIVYTFDCLFMIHETEVTDLTQPVIVNFAICTETNPPDCQAWFYYYPADSVNNLFTYQFIDASIGVYNTWFWDFGDGSTSTEQNPVHAFGQEGTYNVCLTISDSNGDCQNTFCMEIWVGIIPPPTGCENYFSYYQSNDGFTYVFTGFVNTTNPVSYYWDFGDGTYGEGQNVTHTFVMNPNSLNVFDVCLATFTFDDTGDSCFDISCQEVWVGVSPPFDCFNFFNYFLEDSLTVTFSGEAYWGGMITGADSYFWDFGDGTTGEGQVVTHTFPSGDSMSYTVCLTTYILDPTMNDSCYAVSCQGIGNGGSNDLYTLFGQVIMENSFADVAQVSLFMAAPDGQMILLDVQPVDSAGHYAFYQIMSGNYYLMAELLPGSSEYGNYIPTYYENAMSWSDADMIFLGEPFNPYNINLIPADGYAPGAGQINGSINMSYGLFRDGEPAGDVEILLMNPDNQPLRYVYSTEEGGFDFDALDWGTYVVHAEVPGKVTTPALVTLDAEHPEITVDFMVTQSEVYNSLSVNEIDKSVIEVGELYPNPFADMAVLPVKLSRSSVIYIEIYNQLGQQVYSFRNEYPSGNHMISMDLGSLNKGMYLMKASTDQTNLVIRKIVK